MAIDLQAAIAVFDKSADRTKPNAQTEAWAVIRAELMRVPVADSAKLANGYTVERHAREMVEGHYPNHREYMVAAAYLALRERVMGAPVARPLELQCAGFDDPDRDRLERLIKSGKRVRLVPADGGE